MCEENRLCESSIIKSICYDKRFRITQMGGGGGRGRSLWADIRDGESGEMGDINNREGRGERGGLKRKRGTWLKVHKRENFLGSDIEICTFS